jgi:hypothetical protein
MAEDLSPTEATILAMATWQTLAWLPDTLCTDNAGAQLVALGKRTFGRKKMRGARFHPSWVSWDLLP